MALGRRLAAATVDGAATALLTVALSRSTGRFFAERAVVALRLDDPDGPWKGPVPLLLGAVGELSYGLPLAALLILGAEFVSGLTPGKALLGLGVTGPDGGPAATGRRLLRLAIKGIGAWGLALALLVGRWPAVLAAAAAGCVLSIGCLPLFGGRSPLHDVLSGTTVVTRQPSEGETS